MRWLINTARARSERVMAERLAGEILDASQNRGAAAKKREDTHKMAEVTRLLLTTAGNPTVVIERGPFPAV